VWLEIRAHAIVDYTREGGLVAGSAAGNDAIDAVLDHQTPDRVGGKSPCGVLH
jgi:hypothetical protein